MDIKSDSFELSTSLPVDSSATTAATANSKNPGRNKINKDMINGISFLNSLFPTESASAEIQATAGTKVEPRAVSYLVAPKYSHPFKKTLAFMFRLPRSGVQEPSPSQQVVAKEPSNSSATRPYTKRLLCYDVTIVVLVVLIIICIVSLVVLFVNKHEEDEYEDYHIYGYNSFGNIREPF